MPTRPSNLSELPRRRRAALLRCLSRRATDTIRRSRDVLISCIPSAAIPGVERSCCAAWRATLTLSAVPSAWRPATIAVSSFAERSSSNTEWFCSSNIFCDFPHELGQGWGIEGLQRRFGCAGGSVIEAVRGGDDCEVVVAFWHQLLATCIGIIEELIQDLRLNVRDTVHLEGLYI